jgi:hypothetical protein
MRQTVSGKSLDGYTSIWTPCVLQRKLLKKRSDKKEKDDGEPGPSGLPIKQPPTKDGLNPKDAKEVAKKLLMAGKLTIQKQPTRKTGFKRVGELPGQVRADLPAGRLMRESGVFPSLLLQRRSILGPAENQWMKKKGRLHQNQSTQRPT